MVTRPCVGFGDPGQDLQQGVCRRVGPDEPENLARLDLERDVPQRL